MSKARSLLETIQSILDESALPTITGLAFSTDLREFSRLDEGRWVDGRFSRNIRVDQPTSRRGEGQPHAHVFGRKGRELVIVNLDGTGSHGTKGRLHADDAEALRAQGFTVRRDRIVEWWLVGDDDPGLLFG